MLYLQQEAELNMLLTHGSVLALLNNINMPKSQMPQLRQTLSAIGPDHIYQK